MRSLWVRRAALAAFAACAAGCATFGREYEYEEQLYLNVDGSASVVIDSSVAALVALRGLSLQADPRARLDPIAVRHLYESLGCQVVRIGQPWYRHGRRFIQVRLTTPDVRTLSTCQPLAWSTYRFEQKNGAIEYEQKVGPPSAAAPARATWTGAELVAFRLHLPSKVLFHNVRSLKDNRAGEIERGNILTWEQRLSDRQAGTPIDMLVTMDPESILYRTLWLFAGSFLAAVLVLGAIIMWTVRKGRKMRAM